jgi:hypothetical protein
MNDEITLLLMGLLLAVLGFGAGVFVERHRWNALIWWERRRAAARGVTAKENGNV